jgi:hypothetical protein
MRFKTKNEIFAKKLFLLKPFSFKNKLLSLHLTSATQ